MTEFKWITVVIIFLTGLIAGYYPLFKRTTTKTPFTFPLGESFAAGLFLAVGLIHMMPDATKLFEKALPTVYFPLGNFIAAVTFLTLLLLEHVAMSLSHSHEFKEETANAVVYLITLMLAVHSFLMGTALGIENSFATMILIFIAIIAHKGSASFALAVCISKSAMNNVLAITLFSLFLIMTPLGIILGADLQNDLTGNTGVLTQAVFFSLAAGTFLYMSTLHGLKRNPMIEYCCNMKEFSAMLIGFTMMAVVGLMT